MYNHRNGGTESASALWRHNTLWRHNYDVKYEPYSVEPITAWPQYGPPLVILLSPRTITASPPAPWLFFLHLRNESGQEIEKKPFFRIFSIEKTRKKHNATRNVCVALVRPAKRSSHGTPVNWLPLRTDTTTSVANGHDENSMLRQGEA